MECSRVIQWIQSVSSSGGRSLQIAKKPDPVMPRSCIPVTSLFATSKSARDTSARLIRRLTKLLLLPLCRPNSNPRGDFEGFRRVTQEGLVVGRFTGRPDSLCWPAGALGSMEWLYGEQPGLGRTFAKRPANP